MGQDSRTYVENLKKYHYRLQTEILKDRYNIGAKFLTVLSWGYNTSAIYVEDKTKKYILKLTNFSPERDLKVRNDVKFCNILNNIIPTSKYLKDKQGNQISRFEDKIIRVSNFIAGTQALDVNYHIMSQTIEMLLKIHKSNITHGDLTPNNILVSYGKVTAIIDFENADFSSNVELDLARMLFFCWDKMHNTSMCDILKFIKNNYTQVFNTSKLKKHTLDVVEKYIQDIEINREKYVDQSLYKKELELAKTKLTKVRETLLEC